MRASWWLLLLALGGCQWVAEYERVLPVEASDGSIAGDRSSLDGGQHFDGAADGTAGDSVVRDGWPLDAAVDQKRADATRDLATADVSADASARDTSADSFAGDTTHDAFATDTTVDAPSADTTVDTASPDTTVDAGAPSISWTVFEVQQNGASGEIKPEAALITPNGRVVIGGSFRGELLMAAGALPRLSCTASQCPFVIVGANSGSGYVFTVLFRANVEGEVRALARDAAGRLLVGGSLNGTLTLSSQLDSAQLSTAGRDGFVLRFDPSNNMEWVRQIEGTGVDEVWALSAHPSSQDLYAVGGRLSSATISAWSPATAEVDLQAKPGAVSGGYDGFAMVLNGGATIADVVPEVHVFGSPGDDAIHAVRFTDDWLYAAGAHPQALTQGCPPVGDTMTPPDGLVARWSFSSKTLALESCYALRGAYIDEAHRLLWEGAISDPVHVIGTVQRSGLFAGQSYTAYPTGSDFFHGQFDNGGAIAAEASRLSNVEQLLDAALLKATPIFAGAVDTGGSLVEGVGHARTLAAFSVPKPVTMAVDATDNLIVLASETVGDGELPDNNIADPTTVAFIAIGTP